MKSRTATFLPPNCPTRAPLSTTLLILGAVLYMYTANKTDPAGGIQWHRASIETTQSMLDHDMIVLKGATIDSSKNSSRRLSLTCHNKTDSIERKRIQTILIDVNCTSSVNAQPHDSIKIRGTTLLVEFAIAHFPHIAQNLFYALGITYHMGETIDRIMLHGPAAVSDGHGAKWVKDFVNLTGIDLMNENSIGIDNVFEPGGTSSENCANCSNTVIFDRLLMRTANSPIWFPSKESCHWIRAQCSKNLRAQVLKINRNNSILSTDTDNKLVIAIDREGSRGMEGLQTLAEMLQQRSYKVEIYTFEGIPLIDQIRIMEKKASFFLMAHGAAQTNVMFMNTDSVMIEVFPYNYITPYYWYTGLADSCGLKSIAFMNSNSTVFKMRCKNYANSSISECMNQFECRICARGIPTHLDVRSLWALILHIIN